MMEMMNLQQMIAEKRIARKQWMGTDEQGRSTACLLAALHPPCGAARSASVCPASLMPPWMAELTVWIDDAPSWDHWWSVVERYGAIAQRFPELDEKRWERASYRVGAAILRTALPETDDEWGCRRAVAGMIACYESAVETGEINRAARAKWAAAASEAADLAVTAWATWTTMPEEPEEAAEAALAAEAKRAAFAAEAAKAAGAAEAALAAEAAEAKRVAQAALAAGSARADLICGAVLDAIEQAIYYEDFTLQCQADLKQIRNKASTDSIKP